MEIVGLERSAEAAKKAERSHARTRLHADPELLWTERRDATGATAIASLPAGRPLSARGMQKLALGEVLSPEQRIWSPLPLPRSDRAFRSVAWAERLASTAAAVFAAAAPHAVEYVNPAWCRITGHTRNAVLGRHGLGFMFGTRSEAPALAQLDAAITGRASVKVAPRIARSSTFLALSWHFVNTFVRSPSHTHRASLLKSGAAPHPPAHRPPPRRAGGGDLLQGVRATVRGRALAPPARRGAPPPPY
jgi:PAS domain-containing protein